MEDIEETRGGEIRGEIGENGGSGRREMVEERGGETDDGLLTIEKVKAGDGSATGGAMVRVIGELGALAIAEPSTNENLRLLRSSRVCRAGFCGDEVG